MDTIYALATAQGKAGVAIIRISGPRALPAGNDLCGHVPAPRQTALRSLRDGQGAVLDQALVLHFAKNASFTGEDTIELHCHGSVAVVMAVMKRLSEIEGLRLAEPGEFTRRALENGRLDLAQVEGLADLVEAETEAQRRQALRVLSGDLGRKAQDWRADLVRAAALLEVTIDFVDEEVPVDVSSEVIGLLQGVRSGLVKELAGLDVAERIRTGFEVAIIGAPNVGKSTLLNALAGREAAITSEYAGTTRDVIEVRMDLAGLPVTVLDTAGLRETDDHVEGIGIRRARERAASADLRVVLVDGDQVPDLSLTDTDIVLRAKADLSGGDGVSGLTGKGVEELIARISEELVKRSRNAGLATRERHRIALEKAKIGLECSASVVAEGPARYDIAAEELRTAIRALDALVGRVDVENLLDEIFRSFCLGK